MTFLLVEPVLFRKTVISEGSLESASLEHEESAIETAELEGYMEVLSSELRPREPVGLSLLEGVSVLLPRSLGKDIALRDLLELSLREAVILALRESVVLNEVKAELDALSLFLEEGVALRKLAILSLRGEDSDTLPLEELVVLSVR